MLRRIKVWRGRETKEVSGCSLMELEEFKATGGKRRSIAFGRLLRSLRRWIQVSASPNEQEVSNHRHEQRGRWACSTKLMSHKTKDSVRILSILMETVRGHIKPSIARGASADRPTPASPLYRTRWTPSF